MLAVGQAHTRLRNRIAPRRLRLAVQAAVQRLFAFTHRDQAAGALWSCREQVWLGRSTFVSWAMHEAAIDLPWLVANSAGAPHSDKELQTAVQDELISLWKEPLVSLPSMSTPGWLPLP